MDDRQQQIERAIAALEKKRKQKIDWSREDVDGLYRELYGDQVTLQEFRTVCGRLRAG